MIAEIIGISTPVLFGDKKDPRAKSYARDLMNLGIHVKFTTPAKDSAEGCSVLQDAFQRSDIILIAGGMEPSCSTIRQKAAELLGLPLVTEEKNRAKITEHFHNHLGEDASVRALTDIRLPEGSEIFLSQYEYALAAVVNKDNKCIVLLPADYESYFEFLYGELYEYLIQLTKLPIVSQTIHALSLTEEQLRQKLGDIILSTNPIVSVYPGRYTDLIRITAKSENQLNATILCNSVVRTVCESLGEYAFGRDGRSLSTLVYDLLKEKELSITAALSGTERIFSAGMAASLPEKLNGGIFSIGKEDVLSTQLELPAKVLDGYAFNSPQIVSFSAIRARIKRKTDLAVAASSPRPGQDFAYIAVADDKNIYMKKVTFTDNTDPRQTLIVHLYNLLRLYLEGSACIINNMVRSAGILCGDLNCFGFLEEPENKDVEPVMEAVSEPTAVVEKPPVTADPFQPDVVPIESEPEPEEEEPKKSVLRRIREYLFPCRGDSTGEKIRKIVFLIALIVLLVSGGFLLSYFIGGESNRALNDDLKHLYGNEVDLDDYPDDYSPYFRALYARNQDIKGWISIAGTDIDYPVVQTDNNDFYLKHDFDKNESKYGTVFLDYRVDAKKPTTNMVIYGHNMNDGQMFGHLANYRDLSYYQEHPTISFETVYEPATYKIVSIFLNDPNEQSERMFDYQNYLDLNDAQFDTFVDQIMNRSLINTGVDVQRGDTFITLSTCVYDFYDARLVIVARKVRDGESANVNVSEASTNYAPYMPDIWYSAFGGTRPEFKTGFVSEPTVSEDSEDTSQPQEDTVSQSSSSSSYQSSWTPPAESEAPQTSTAPETSSVPETPSRAPSPEPEPESEPEPEPEPEPSEEPEAPSEPDTPDESTASEETAPANVSYPSSSSVSPSPLGYNSLATNISSLSALMDTIDNTSFLTNAPVLGGIGGFSALSTNPLTRTFSLTSPINSIQVMSTGISPFSLDTLAARTSGCTVQINGSSTPQDAYTVLCRVVGAEMDDSFHSEALKAQAVAAYTFIKYNNASGTYPYVPSREAGPKVKAAVSAVLGQAMYIDGEYIYTPYFACSGGRTNAAKDVWGYETKQLQSVESKYDYMARDYEVTKVYSVDEVKRRIQNTTGITLSGDPANWFQVLSYTSGGYVGRMSIGGHTTYYNNLLKKTTDITGRFFREDIFNDGSIDLRSAKFLIQYRNGQFYITTWGYGHGAGMSQWGANLYAIQEGWDYKDILHHYYQGVTIA